MVTWRRHPKEDLERVLMEFAAHGWRIDDPLTYYRLRCPCGKHVRWLHLPLSNLATAQALQVGQADLPLTGPLRRPLSSRKTSALPHSEAHIDMAPWTP